MQHLKDACSISCPDDSGTPLVHHESAASSSDRNMAGAYINTVRGIMISADSGAAVQNS